MLIFKQISDLNAYLDPCRATGKLIGFVPTMGALHDGHLSLIAASRAECDLTVCSIFVNPTQFNEADDFQKYPRTTAQDIELLDTAQCDVLFLPDVAEIYPNPNDPPPDFDFGYLDKPMEGSHRPGHFRGMAQVVKRLLEVVQPNNLYMGQKDFQQAAIVRQMLKILQSPVRLTVCPTMREPDGLAMSSRNTRLSPADRTKAAVLYQTLCWAKQHLNDHTPEMLTQKAVAQLAAVEGVRPEYFELAYSETLRPVSSNDSIHDTNRASIVALVAVRLGDVRLIDNMIMRE